MSSKKPMFKVWDPLVRLFHWSLVLFFFIAYFAEIDSPRLHSYSGYAILLMLLFRIVWGFIGTPYAKFQDFLCSPRVIWAYLGRSFGDRRLGYVGHNPAGALMIVVMLAGLLITALSGLTLFAMEGSGPLAHTVVATLPASIVEPIHEIAADVMVVMVVLHVAGVLVASKLHRENLMLAMITGKKPVRTSNGQPAAGVED